MRTFTGSRGEVDCGIEEEPGWKKKKTKEGGRKGELVFCRKSDAVRGSGSDSKRQPVLVRKQARIVERPKRERTPDLVARGRRRMEEGGERRERTERRGCERTCGKKTRVGGIRTLLQ